MSVQERLDQNQKDIELLEAEKERLLKEATHKPRVGDLLKCNSGNMHLVVKDWEPPYNLITVSKYGDWCNGRMESLESYLKKGYYIFIRNVFD